MGYLKTREQTPKVHQLQTLSFFSMWVVETIQETGCMHRKQSTNACVAMTRVIAQGEDGVKAICNQTLGRKFSQWRWVSFLHKTKQTLRYQGNWIEPGMGSLPLICYFCQIFKRVGRKVCGVQNEQHVWLTGTFWPKSQQMFFKKRCLCLFYYMCFFWLCEVYLFFWPHWTWNTRPTTRTIMCSSHHLQFAWGQGIGHRSEDRDEDT